MNWLNRRSLKLAAWAALLVAGSVGRVAAQQDADEIVLKKLTWKLNEKPTPITVSGFTGEVDQVLKFDLEVMGFVLVPTGSAGLNYQVVGSNSDHVEGRLIDLVSKAQLLGKAYSGGSLRYQAHTLADEIANCVPNHKGIARTRIAFKRTEGANSEIYISDYDSFNAQPVTRDNSITAAPAFVRGRMALYYTSYKLGHPDIYYQNLTTGERRVFAQYPGSDLSPAPSPDGSRVAMILSKDGWTDLYVSHADGSGLLRLTKSREDESSPCWSPDGKWICFATKINGRRTLCKVPSSGGETQSIKTGVSAPTEPDWSPDGKWIAFTGQGRYFDIYVVPAEGGTATPLVAGEDPSWAPNSRNLVFGRRAGDGGAYTLSVLDVPTKQEKTLRRISGSCSQPSWAR